MIAHIPAFRFPARPRSDRTRAAPKAPGTRGARGGQSLLSAPFDLLRLQYAGAVTLGFTPRSIVAAGRLERSVDALEKLILGPLARQR